MKPIVTDPQTNKPFTEICNFHYEDKYDHQTYQVYVFNHPGTLPQSMRANNVKLLGGIIIEVNQSTNICRIRSSYTGSQQSTGIVAAINFMGRSATVGNIGSDKSIITASSDSNIFRFDRNDCFMCIKGCCSDYGPNNVETIINLAIRLSQQAASSSNTPPTHQQAFPAYAASSSNTPPIHQQVFPAYAASSSNTPPTHQQVFPAYAASSSNTPPTHQQAFPAYAASSSNTQVYQQAFPAYAATNQRYILPPPSTLDNASVVDQLLRSLQQQRR